MAYPVSEDWKERVYGDKASYTYTLSINNNEIPTSLIENIKISNPIVDTEQKYFYIGTFISQKITIKFRNLNGIDLHSGDVVELSCRLMKEDSTYEYAPIGTYLIDDLSEDYKTKCEIKCLDYSVKFSNNVDYSNVFYHLTQDIEIDNEKTYFTKIGEGKTESFVEVGTPVLADIGTYYEYTGEATLLEILQWLCRYFGVPLGTYPNVNNNVLTQQYSNELTGKRYVSYIAEMFGGNAKIDRYGVLNIIPLVTTPVININAHKGKSFALGEQYKITRVVWDDALRNFNFGDETNNTLYIRSDNFFVTEESQIENIYNAVNGFEIYSLMQEAPADLSLDSWDLVNYIFNGNTYTTWNNNTITITSSTMAKLETKIPSETQEETTNRIGTEVRFRKLRTDVDRNNNRINILAGETQGNTNRISKLSIDVEKINNIFQLQGGNNLIKNSAFLLTDKVWEFEELVEDSGEHTELGKSYTTNYLGTVISNAEIKLKNTKMVSKPELNNILITQLNNAHTFSFKYKMDDFTEATVRLINPSDNSVIFETELEPTEDITEVIGKNIIPRYSNIVLQVETTTTNDGYLYLYDMLLNIGDKQTWSPAADELISTVIRLSQLGITILARGSDFATIMSSNEFSIYKATYNGEEVNLGERVSKFDGNGIETTDIKSKSVSTGKYVMEDRNWGGVEHHIEYFRDESTVQNSLRSLKRQSYNTVLNTDNAIVSSKKELSSDESSTIVTSYNSAGDVISSTQTPVAYTSYDIIFEEDGE